MYDVQILCVSANKNISCLLYYFFFRLINESTNSCYMKNNFEMKISVFCSNLCVLGIFFYLEISNDKFIMLHK